jgi:hypothetical protein
MRRSAGTGAPGGSRRRSAATDTGCDKRESATFVVEVLGLDEPRPYGPFIVGRSTTRSPSPSPTTTPPVHPQRYAFLVTESDFDEIFGHIRGRGLSYWAHPGRRRLGESIPTMLAGACTGKIGAGTSSRSSPVRSAADADRKAHLSTRRPAPAAPRTMLAHAAGRSWGRTRVSADLLYSRGPQRSPLQ